MPWLEAREAAERWWLNSVLGSSVNKSAIFESKFMTSGVERLVELAVGWLIS